MKSYEIKELEMPCSITTENEQKLAYELAQVMVENEELRQEVYDLKLEMLAERAVTE